MRATLARIILFNHFVWRRCNPDTQESIFVV